jgi:hypothetical protein
MRYIEVPARYLVSQRVGENLEKVQGDPEQPIATILRQREPISREFRVCQSQHAMANTLQRMALRNDHDQVRQRKGQRRRISRSRPGTVLFERTSQRRAGMVCCLNVTALRLSKLTSRLFLPIAIGEAGDGRFRAAIGVFLQRQQNPAKRHVAS